MPGAGKNGGFSRNTARYRGSLIGHSTGGKAYWIAARRPSVNMLALASDQFESVQAISDLVLDRLGASSSKLAYARALRDFLVWYASEPGARFDKATVQRYRAELVDAGLAPSSINQRLSAIRALAQEAADNHLVDPQLASGIGKVKGVKSAGTRTGNWLTQTQAQALLDAPDTATLKGVRDQAILGVLLGCGLRRSELAALTFGHLQ
jgi:site-specific recombinase XerD